MHVSTNLTNYTYLRAGKNNIPPYHHTLFFFLSFFFFLGIYIFVHTNTNSDNLEACFCLRPPPLDLVARQGGAKGINVPCPNHLRKDYISSETLGCAPTFRRFCTM